jgi:hypothetical protein
MTTALGSRQGDLHLTAMSGFSRYLSLGHFSIVFMSEELGPLVLVSARIPAWPFVIVIYCLAIHNLVNTPTLIVANLVPPLSISAYVCGIAVGLRFPGGHALPQPLCIDGHIGYLDEPDWRGCHSPKLFYTRAEGPQSYVGDNACSLFMRCMRVPGETYVCFLRK